MKLDTAKAILEWATSVDATWDYHPVPGLQETETAERLALAVRVLEIVEREAAPGRLRQWANNVLDKAAKITGAK